MLAALAASADGAQSPPRAPELAPAHAPAAAAPKPAAVASVSSATRALESAPPDATLFLRLEDGAGLGRAPECGALAKVLGAQVLLREGSDQWTSLARRLGLSEREMFERYLGADLRLALREQTTKDGAGYDWALLTRVAEADMDRLVQALRPAIRAGGRFELPEDKLALAYRAPWLAVGPSATSHLFADVAERFDAPLDRNLLTVAKDGGLDGVPPTGRLTVAMILPPPFSGCGLMGGDIRDGKLALAFRGAFAAAPMPGSQQTMLDVSVLARFDDTCIAALADPIRTSVGPEDGFLVSVMPELVPSATFRANLGKQRLLLFGESEGARLQPPLHMRCPTFAVAYQVDDAEQARDDQDALVLRCYDALGARVAKPEGITLGAASIPKDGPKDGPRSAPIEPLVAKMTGGHPIARGWSLHWGVVRGASGNWQVYATSPEWLATVSRILRDGPAPKAELVSAASAGCCCGMRLASHVRSWSGEADAFAKAAATDDAEGLRKGIELIASVAERFGRVRWTIGTPSERRLSIDIEAELVPAQSER